MVHLVHITQKRSLLTEADVCWSLKHVSEKIPPVMCKFKRLLGVTEENGGK